MPVPRPPLSLITTACESSAASAAPAEAMASNEAQPLRRRDRLLRDHPGFIAQQRFVIPAEGADGGVSHSGGGHLGLESGEISHKSKKCYAPKLNRDGFPVTLKVTKQKCFWD